MDVSRHVEPGGSLTDEVSKMYGQKPDADVSCGPPRHMHEA